MKAFIPSFCALGCLALATARAADLKESKFTQVVNDVQVISTEDNSKHAAAVDVMFKLPDVVRTGAASRAELVAADRTITRIGANTIFSFDVPTRTIKLDHGSLLFNAPKGKGGGTIHTAAATAAVLGTTIIVTTTDDGGFKVLVLEGKAEVKFLNGVRRHIKAGQMIFVLPGSKVGPVVVFRLDHEIAGSLLVNGFSDPLPSLPLINQEISHQIHLIQTGQETDTGLLVGGFATPTSVQTISVFTEVSASPGASNGIIAGLNGTPPPTTFTLPPGFVVPPGLTFDPTTGGFLTPNGLLFVGIPGPTGITPAIIIATAAEAAASLVDATITGSPLDPAHLFPTGVTITEVTGANPGSVRNFPPGFGGQNLNFNVANVDMSPYTARPQFGFGASQNIIFNGPNSFLNSPPQLGFLAAQNITFNSDSSLTTDAGTLLLSCSATLTMLQATINSPSTVQLDSHLSMDLNGANINGASVNISSDGPITTEFASINGGANNADFVSFNSSASLTLSDTFVNGNNLIFSSVGPMTFTRVDGAGITANNAAVFLPTVGMTLGVDVTAVNQSGTGTIGIQNGPTGIVTVNNGAHFTADLLSVTSPSGILFDNTTMSISAGGVATLNAANTPGSTITVQNTTFDNLGSLVIMAYTIVLNGVTFQAGTTGIFGCGNGQANFGSVVPGDANFINTTVGGQDISGFVGGPGSGKQFIVTKN